MTNRTPTNAGLVAYPWLSQTLGNLDLKDEMWDSLASSSFRAELPAVVWKAYWDRGHPPGKFVSKAVPQLLYPEGRVPSGFFIKKKPP